MDNKQIQLSVEDVINAMILEQNKLEKKINKVKFWSNFKIGLMTICLIYYIGYNQGRWEEVFEDSSEETVNEEK